MVYCLPCIAISWVVYSSCFTPLPVYAVSVLLVIQNSPVGALQNWPTDNKTYNNHFWRFSWSSGLTTWMGDSPVMTNCNEAIFIFLYCKSNIFLTSCINIRYIIFIYFIIFKRKNILKRTKILFSIRLRFNVEGRFISSIYTRSFIRHSHRPSLQVCLCRWDFYNAINLMQIWQLLISIN